MSQSIKLKGKQFEFPDLKAVLAKASEEKSGDRLAGLAASSALERVAAKALLASTTLETLRDQPVLSIESDEISRLVRASLDDGVFSRIRDWTVADLRHYILSTEEDPRWLSPLLTGEMAAALTKLMSNLDLVLAARRFAVVVKNRTTLGLNGRLSSRLQPNHPSDAIAGIEASIYTGLSYGVGDAVIGINPAFDSAESVAVLLDETHRLIEELEVPTHNCVLSHITTQLAAIKNGAPCDLIFQSIAGTQAANRSFGIDADLIAEAYHSRDESCPPFMYFETGQGSELSSSTHAGVDQLTLEARCYAFARLFRPFLVNDVVGFIGPEYLYNGEQMIRAGLEDHFMAKLLGLPMGVDACYTNHMQASQNDLENLAMLLTASGVNYFMGVPMGDDVMLSYQTTSFHDIGALRQLHSLRPAPEFEVWLESRGLMKDGALTRLAGQGRKSF